MPTQESRKHTVYPRIEHLYEARAGAGSGESDYGFHNTDDLGILVGLPTVLPPKDDQIRVSYIEDTGDVYAAHPFNGTVALLGSIVNKDGTPYSFDQASTLFENWEYGEPGHPLSWFTARIESTRNYDHPQKNSQTRYTAWTQECEDCHGTGLYRGIGESKDTAVVCKTCTGTGCQHIEKHFTHFAGRKPPPPEVLRVFSHNPGIKLHPTMTPGGVTTQEWLEDPTSASNPGMELRDTTCPKWWYLNQPEKDPDWDHCIKRIHAYYTCPMFHAKQKCWQEWDKEQASRDPT